MVAYLRIAVLVLVLMAACARGRFILDVDEAVSDDGHRVSLWATRAHDWLLDSACADSSAGASAGASAGDLCRDLVRVPRAQIRVYAAGRGTTSAMRADAEPVMATLVGPQGGRAMGPHDAVLVLDPYPTASFGHLVLVFFVALGTTEERCGHVRGLHLGNGDCVQPAREPRCSPGGGAGAEAGAGQGAGAPCELLFLPLVTPASRPPHQHHDTLQCRQDIAGFAASSCPQLRPLSETTHLHCGHDPHAAAEDAKHCDTTQFIRTRCPFMQTCDHAVVLSGGWNRHLSDTAALQNVLDFHAMLKHVGFHDDNIKVFFANGVQGGEGAAAGAGPVPAMYPSALKLALRYHLHRLCETARCADTLLLYLNGPALPGGSTLLWDVDGNGQLDDGEVYSAAELLRDVSHCGARRVVIMADQSYARDLVRHAAQLHASSRGLRNVVVLASPTAAPAAAPSRTSHWTDPRHRHDCLADLAPERAVSTDPDADALFVGSTSLLNTTLTGMPCSLVSGAASAAAREQQRLRHRYSGCQNLSTREWMAAQDDPQDSQDSQDQDDEEDDDDQAKRSRSENNA